jgi:hypothetical protein
LPARYRVLPPSVRTGQPIVRAPWLITGHLMHYDEACLHLGEVRRNLFTRPGRMAIVR